MATPLNLTAKQAGALRAYLETSADIVDALAASNSYAFTSPPGSGNYERRNALRARIDRLRDYADECVCMLGSRAQMLAVRETDCIFKGTETTAAFRERVRNTSW